MRILGGAITLYTVFAYSFMLQDFMGPEGWYNLELRQEITRNRPNMINNLSGSDYDEPTPSSDFEIKYHQKYFQRFGVPPPPPYPRDQAEADRLQNFRLLRGVDLRVFGLPPPRNREESAYVDEYMNHNANTMRLPPPAYPANAEERAAIYDYMERHGGVDPRRVYALGQPAWSIWFHVTDPAMMTVVHGLVVLVTFLFMIGFCTRLTSALTWMTSLWYIHRNPVALFGVDTMMTILLFYLMIGNCGGAYSVDRLIARWWSKAKPSIVNRWRRLFGQPALDAAAIRPAVYSPAPVPTVSTNVALRMLQIHLCIIYFVAGIAKLLGNMWWSGTAVWGTLANFEFAPMAFEINGVQVYNEILRWLAGNQTRIELVLTAAGYGTLAFEICYLFLVWRPATRWVILSGAILLHGFIGLFMGLKTFSLMMLVLNMAFVKTEEAQRLLGMFGRLFGAKPPAKQKPKLEPVAAFAGDNGAGAGTTATEPALSTHIKQKK